MADAAGKLAGSFSKEVANSLRVVAVHGKQVQLKMQILEDDRTKLEQLGFNVFSSAGRNIGGTTTEQFPTTASQTAASATGIATETVSNPLNFYLYNAKLNLGLTVQDLEQKNVAQILAEPTLTTMSGEQAHFLSGGEFPFPVVQGGTDNGVAVTIQFRPYGVKMDFTPTVNGDGSIRLKIAPEVSTLDYTNAVTISGYTIPALDTRKADTEVELKDGQSFALTGLLDHRTTENLAKTPGIASVPILGELFKSKNNTHSIVELVVIVTAHVVDPVTDAGPIDRPEWALPNMTESAFDKQLHKERPKDVPNPQDSTTTEK
jgi:pilus assembly protein CpaC